MPLKLKVGKSSHPLLWNVARFLLVLVLMGAAFGGIIFGIYYYRYRNVVQEWLAKGPLFPSVAQIYAAPQDVRPGIINVEK